MLGDLDADGDLDVVVTQCDAPTRIYRNQAPREGGWLVVRAVDLQLGRDALGARVILDSGSHSSLRVLTSSHSYMVGREPIAHFGVPETGAVEAISVEWPDGASQSWRSLPTNRRLTLYRADRESP
jgi:hypothetical protein